MKWKALIVWCLVVLVTLCFTACGQGNENLSPSEDASDRLESSSGSESQSQNPSDTDGETDPGFDDVPLSQLTDERVIAFLVAGFREVVTRTEYWLELSWKVRDDAGLEIAATGTLSNVGENSSVDLTLTGSQKSSTLPPKVPFEGRFVDGTCYYHAYRMDKEVFERADGPNARVWFDGQIGYFRVLIATSALDGFAEKTLERNPDGSFTLICAEPNAPTTMVADPSVLLANASVSSVENGVCTAEFSPDGELRSYTFSCDAVVDAHTDSWNYEGDLFCEGSVSFLSFDASEIPPITAPKNAKDYVESNGPPLF